MGVGTNHRPGTDQSPKYKCVKRGKHINADLTKGPFEHFSIK